MNKKVFTLLLLAVFMLAQFSMASAATQDGETAIAPLDAFHDTSDVDLDWSVTGMDGVANQHLYILLRNLSDPANDEWQSGAGWCTYIQDVSLLTSANGTFPFPLNGSADDDQDVDEFRAILSDQLTCALVFAALEVDVTDPAQASTFIDGDYPYYFMGNYPSIETPFDFNNTLASCNTFEMWGLGSDSYFNAPGSGYSGIGAWNLFTTGTFAPPAPEGPQSELLSWIFSFPATANGAWSMTTDLADKVGNQWPGGPFPFRNAEPIDPSEVEDCADFTDTAGHAEEVYIRYLADLGLIAGNPDGSFGPDTTLTRAEAAVLFEKANGYDDTVLPTSAPVGCEFTDVSAADWFAGWVWQACVDGFMNGIGGGLFDPSNLLTRGQVVTIFNNIVNNGFGVAGSYLDDGTVIDTVLAEDWGILVRTGAWTDVMIGAYYAQGVINAYGAGVAEGTSATTFSPDQAILRGEFAKMLYHALSREW